MGKITTTVVMLLPKIRSNKILIMSRLPTSLLSNAGLVLATVLAVLPVGLNAEPNPTNPVLRAPTAAPQPPNGLPSVPSTVNPASIQKPVTQPLDIKTPVTGATIITPAKPAAATNPPSKSTTTTTTTPTIPAKSVTTTTAAPTTPKQPISTPTGKPGTTAATKQPHVGETVNLVLKLKERKVYVYKGDQVLGKYPVAIGKKNTPTVTGEWYVMEKITNPGWTNFNTGKFVKPGPNNPMGERWIGFYTDGKDMIGFHGTPDVKSIGKAVSNGCVRMFNKDVKAIFPLVEVGTVVKVVNE
jgi:lipoprotein-anchoring transpeptidase ErfK/SrfK